MLQRGKFMFVLQTIARYKLIALFRGIIYYKLSFSEFENQEVPNLIFMCHILVMGLGFLLTIVVTAGYVAACENIRAPER